MTRIDTLPQFTPEYWEKAPRKMGPQLAIVNMNTKDGWKHIQLANGVTLRHPQDMVQQLLTVGTVVQAQYIKTQMGEVVTGCYLPQVNGWAWKLTAQDLADHVKAVSIAAEKRAELTHQRMVEYVAEQLVEAMATDDLLVELTNNELATLSGRLAEVAIKALEQGPDDTASNS